MHVLRTLSLAASLLLASLVPLHAADIIVDGEAGCLAIGGSWEGTARCSLARILVPAGTRLVFLEGIAVSVSGGVLIDGTLETHGWFEPNGTLTNRGTLVTLGTTVNAGPIYNDAHWSNYGLLHPHADVVNRGDFDQDFILETCSGAFYNEGFMHNDGYVDNWSGLIFNTGIWLNHGNMFNPDDDYYLFVNSGAFENDGQFENGGRIEGTCGSVWFGTGTLEGNSVIEEPCAPVTVAEHLTAVVFEFGKPGAGLTKDETIALTRSLARAQKRMDAGNYPAAEVALGEFLVVAGDLNTNVSVYVSRAFVAWAERILELMEQ